MHSLTSASAAGSAAGIFPQPPLSLYIHIPWCARKCPYCDFNSHALKGGVDDQLYVNALLQDLRMDHALVSGREIKSVFIGGGTPSLFSVNSIRRLLGGRG
jgi:oxygen-independent coproporphyrinogen-3 oxidase